MNISIYVQIDYYEEALMSQVAAEWKKQHCWVQRLKLE